MPTILQQLKKAEKSLIDLNPLKYYRYGGTKVILVHHDKERKGLDYETLVQFVDSNRGHHGTIGILPVHIKALKDLGLEQENLWWVTFNNLKPCAP